MIAEYVSSKQNKTVKEDTRIVRSEDYQKHHNSEHTD